MAIDVTGVTVNDSEISSDIRIDFPPGLTAAQKNKIKQEAGEIVIDHILSTVSKAKSPIKGAAWEALSADYKKLKKSAGRGTKANMEFSGDMLDELKNKNTKEGFRIQIKGREAPKADGHNNFSGKSILKTRKFLPGEGDEFNGKVDRDIDSIIADEVAKSKKLNKRNFPPINSRRELNEFIREEFPGVSVQQAKDAILLNDELREEFSDLLDFF